MPIEIRERALRSARELFPLANIDDIILTATKIERYLVNGANHSDLLPFVHSCKITNALSSRNFTPYQFQKDTLNLMSTSNKLIINTSRQMGISLSASLYVLWEALTKPNQSIVITTNHFSNVNAPHDIITKAYDSFPDGIYPQLVLNTIAKKVFANGSTIEVIQTPDYLNYTPDILIIDNAAFVSHGKMYTFWASVVNQLNDRQFKVIMISTPHDTNGVFYNTCANYDLSWDRIELPWTLHPNRDSGWAEKQKQYLGSDGFSRSHDCKFMPTGRP